MIELQLTIVRVPPGSALTAGVLAPLTGPTVIGRATDSGLVLMDRTVSRQHARIWPSTRGWFVSNISTRNGIFVDGVPVAPGRDAPLEPGAKLQLGGVVLTVDAVEETLPVNEPLSASTRRARLLVRRDGDGCTAHWEGRLMPLPPVAALTLFALARAPSAIVHEWDIQTVVGRPFNLPQAISAIRRAFRGLVQDGIIGLDALAAIVASTCAEEITAVDPDGLARHLVRARRRHGYALMLPTYAVDCEEAG